MLYFSSALFISLHTNVDHARIPSYLTSHLTSPAAHAHPSPAADSCAAALAQAALLENSAESLPVAETPCPAAANLGSLPADLAKADQWAAYPAEGEGSRAACPEGEVGSLVNVLVAMKSSPGS